MALACRYQFCQGQSRKKIRHVKTRVLSLTKPRRRRRMISEETLTTPNEMEQLREQLLRAQRLSSVGTLASSVAHEFNNILTTIMNYAKLGLRPEADEASRVHALDKILKGSQRAAVIISSMLGFARNHSAHREMTDLIALVEETLVLTDKDLKK